MVQVEAVLDEVGRQTIQELWVNGRVGRAKIVRRINNAAPHQLLPNPVHRRARKVRVRGPGEPFGQPRTTVLSGLKRRRSSSQESCLDGLLGIRVLELQVGIDIEEALVVPRPPFEFYLREKRRQSHEVIAPPVLTRMIVTTSAFKADSEEDLA